MKLALIVAMDQNRGIGKDNDLLWHLPADMKFFKETTTGHVVVMGRKNFESIPERFRPLPNRENVVLTRNEDYQAEGCLVFHSLEAAIAHYQETGKTVFIIGGGQIYQEALANFQMDEMYITEVAANIEADTFFPAFDENQYQIGIVQENEKDEKNPYSFVIKKYSK